MKIRIFTRNHWNNNFNDGFIIKIGYQYQGFDVKVYHLGLFNVCLCLIMK